MTLTIERLEEVGTDLSQRAFLYDDPETFRAAIELAMQLLRDAAERDRAAATARHPASLSLRDTSA